MARNGGGVYSLPAIYEAVPGDTILATQHNTPLEDIEADLNIARPVVAGGTGGTTTALATTGIKAVSYGDAQTLTAAQQEQARDNIGVGLRGRIWGLTLSNNVSDATNDIDIAVGEAASTETSPVLMVLGAAITKRLDASWSVGTNQGGLDTGAIANATYHVWLIQRSDTGVVDALFSTSASAPTMPTNYDRKRRIGSIVRASAAIRAFFQSVNKFMWTTPVSDRSSTAAVAPGLLTLTVPGGIVVWPVILQVMATSTAGLHVTDMASAGIASSAATICQGGLANQVSVQIVDGTFLTNTSSQINFDVTIASGSLSLNTTTTLGWYDDLGRNA